MPRKMTVLMLLTFSSSILACAQTTEPQAKSILLKAGRI
jgi:hypothetical protein